MVDERVVRNPAGATQQGYFAVGAVLFVWLMLFSLAPMYGIFFLTGGISASEILFVFAMITEVTVIIGLIGLFCSIQWKRTVTAVTPAVRSNAAEP